MATECLEFVENGNKYNDILEIFNRNRREQERHWVEGMLIPKLAEKLKTKDSKARSELKVLAVGSGKGSFDCMFFEALFSKGKELVAGKQVTCTVVEPNESAIEKFKQTIASKGGFFQKVSFNWANKGIGEFLDFGGNETYDLVHFMHVLGYVREELVLKGTYEKLLKSPGCIFIATGSDDNIWQNLYKSFFPMIPTLKSEFYCQSNTGLSKVCQSHGWEYEKFDGKVDLEITEMFEHGNPLGEALLKFFLHIDENLKKKYGEELFSDVIEFFRKMSWEKIENGQKRLFVKDDDGILLISK